MMGAAARTVQAKTTAEGEQAFEFERIRSGRPFPPWLVAELRSDHAGEVGAVEIYRGALAATRDCGLRSAILRHMETEKRHLRAMERVLDPSERSWLVPVWRLAGWMLGFTSSIAGRNTYHHTIRAVETFVDHHYQAQIDRLEREGAHADLLRLLRSCQADEVEHRDEAAQEANGAPGFVGRIWSSIVGFGCAAAVAGARRF
jgi:ubiquinone biosynthesis monooxygenase Coq7